MNTNAEFLKAKNDKDINSFLVIDREEYTDNTLTTKARRKYMRLCLEKKKPYSQEKESIFVESETSINYEDYSEDHKFKIYETRIETCFHCSIYRSGSHILTFLKAIKKDSEVKFKVIAFNGCEFYKATGLTHHSLYGVVNDNYYFLSDYVGNQNLASPIRY